MRGAGASETDLPERSGSFGTTGDDIEELSFATPTATSDNLYGGVAGQAVGGEPF